ncbi:MAG: DUF2325 domain-containing protein [Thiohalophilus sp.]
MCTTKQSYLSDNEAKSARSGIRRKIWQLDGPFHCSVIGTCLTLKELRDLSQKLCLAAPASLTNYQLHRRFVTVVANPGYSARRINKYLDRKYRTAIHRFGKAKEEKALAELWQQALDSGDLAGAYWALITHPTTPCRLIDQAYGEVHMLSHLSGATVRIDMQELNRLKRVTRELDQQLGEAKARHRQQQCDRDIIIDRLQERLDQANEELGELNELRKRVAVMEREPLAVTLHKQVEDLTSRLSEALRRTEQAETRAQQAEAVLADNNHQLREVYEQLAVMQDERDSLENTLERLVTPECGPCEDHTHCTTTIDLCGRCILYVGGRSRQCANFRSLVERHNGRFIHHDGGLDDGKLRLQSILSQADTVLCPLDCVSHDAAQRVKYHCKRFDKRLVFLRQSSLAAFNRALNELTA